MYLGSVSHVVAVTAIQLCATVWKQPEITCHQTGVAMFSKHFQAEIWNPHNFCVPPKCDSFFFKQLKILFKIYISSYQRNIQKQMTGQIWPKGYTLPIPATKELMGDSLVAQRLKRLPPMWETRVWSLGHEDPLEKEMATHSSILAWRIPWTEEPGGLQSTGSQRVRHNWVTLLTYLLGNFRCKCS